MSEKKIKSLSKIAQQQKESAIALSPFEKSIVNVSRKPAEDVPHVNLKYYHSEYQCLSEWQPAELRHFSAFINKLRSSKWQGIQMTGGAIGYKAGFGYTPHKDRKKLPKHPDLDKISEEITFFELRVSQEMRVHGFRCLDAFYLVWLDREHKVYV